MHPYKSEYLNILQSRGFLHQLTDAIRLDELLYTQSITAYIGFDCTAPSLHVGSLMQIMLLRWLQKCGHKPIVLVGGGTTKVGDPSGKDESRKLLSAADIESNKNGIKQVFSNLISFADNIPNSAVMIDNAQWLDKLNYIEFLRDYGRHFSVNRMLSMDSVKLRLEREQNLSFLEFNYMVLQAYDFAELQKQYNCILQMGGSDQWGNIINGIELARRCNNAEIFGLTTPLLTTSSGAKMGKTAQGAVWLNADMLPVYDFWQYFRNTEDADVGRFLRLFTELPLEEITRLEKLKDAEINEAKKILATEICALIHGREEAVKAAETARKTFEEGELAENLPTINFSSEELLAGVRLIDVIVKFGFAPSNGEARKLIRGGGVKLNDEVMSNENFSITTALFTAPQIKLSVGKKRNGILQHS